MDFAKQSYESLFFIPFPEKRHKTNERVVAPAAAYPEMSRPSTGSLSMLMVAFWISVVFWVGI